MFRQAFALFTTGIAIFSCAAVCSANEPATKYCRVRFGNNAKEVLITRTSDSILIHRDGNLDSEPDRHAMKGSRLSGDAIKPFQNKSVTYQITSVEEHREDEQHVLLVHVNTTDVMAPLTQIAEIELSSDVEETQCAQFDGLLRIAPLEETPGEVYPSRLEIGAETKLMGTISTTDEDGCITHVESLPGSLLAMQSPKVTIEFPTGNAEKPIVRSFTLDTFC